jgi:uncharacterized protein YlxW (UPF0749 family)
MTEKTPTPPPGPGDEPPRPAGGEGRPGKAEKGTRSKATKVTPAPKAQPPAARRPADEPLSPGEPPTAEQLASTNELASTQEPSAAELAQATAQPPAAEAEPTSKVTQPAVPAADDKPAPADEPAPRLESADEPPRAGKSEPAADAGAAAAEPAPDAGARPAQAEPAADAGAQPADAGPADAARAADVPEPAAKPVSARRRSVRAGAVVALLCGILGFALAAQLRNNEGESQFDNARQSDLVRILDELNSREQRLRDEIADLQFRRESINSKAEGSEAALDDARKRATDLGILAGTIPAEGPGLVITFTEKGDRLQASTILDAVEELRGSGAEALQIAGAESEPIRIGASTYFADTDDGIEVDGTRIKAPYRLVVVGEPATMDGALKIPGGIVENVREAGSEIDIRQSRQVQIGAVREARAPKFARPAS